MKQFSVQWKTNLKGEKNVCQATKRSGKIEESPSQPNLIQSNLNKTFQLSLFPKHTKRNLKKNSCKSQENIFFIILTHNAMDGKKMFPFNAFYCFWTEHTHTHIPTKMCGVGGSIYPNTTTKI